MAKAPKHKWEFSPRFRRNAFGWKSQPAIKRIKEAVSEIKRVYRKDPVLGVEGAVLFLEKVSEAIQHVDGSSGAIGTAVNNAIEALVPLIAQAPADRATRERWLDRLWQTPLLGSVGAPTEGCYTAVASAEVSVSTEPLPSFFLRPEKRLG